MSVVTTVIVVLGWQQDRETIDAVEQFAWGGRQAHFVKDHIDPCGDLVGGQKCTEADIWISAFNHLPWDDFLAHLDTVPWRSPEDSCVVLQSCDLDAVYVYFPKRSTEPHPAESILRKLIADATIYKLSESLVAHTKDGPAICSGEGDRTLITQEEADYLRSLDA